MKKMKKFYLYRKIILSFLVLNIISITFISGVLSVVFMRTAKKELYNYSMNSLSRMDSSASKIYESLFPVINVLLTNGNAGSFMERRSIERVGELKLLEDLKGLSTANAQFKYMGVANLVTDRYLGTRGVYTGIDADIKEIIKSGESIYCMPRQVRQNENLEDSPMCQVLTFVYAPKGRHMNGLIIIDIDTQEFGRILTGSGGETDAETVYILDSAGQVLVAANEKEDMAGQALIEKDLSRLTGAHETYYEEKVGGEDYSIASLRSEDTGWYFVSLRSKAEILPMMKELIYIIVVAEVVMIAIDLAITFFLASHIYQPLGSLYKRLQKVRDGENEDKVNEIEAFDIALESYEKKNTYLEEYKDKAACMISDYWLRGLARGEINPVDTQLPENCVYSLEDGYYRVLLLAFVDYDIFEEKYSDKDRDIIEFALSNIVGELMGSFCVNEMIMADRNCRMLLIKTPTEVLSDEIILGIKEVQQKFVEYMHIFINACYSPVMTGWRQIPDGYKSARGGLRKQFFLGDGCIIDAGFDYGRGGHKEYPYKAVKSIAEAIVLENGAGALKSIDTFIGRLEQMDVESIVKFSTQACYELCQKYSPAESPTRNYSYQSIYNAIDKMERMDEIREFIRKLSEQLQKEREESKNPGVTKDAVHEARSYIDGHYSDDNLSVEMLADQVGLSPAYFGKLFGSVMNQSCNDYIQEVRMHKAAQLLSDTDRTVNDISMAVGINNTNYFYSIFKKKYGLTPAGYRKKVREERRQEQK